MIRFLAALISLTAFGQDDVFRVDARLVVLHASVLDKSGNLVTTLAPDQFKVFENNVPQQIKLARREDIPVSMGIVIDNSSSMTGRRAKVEAAAIALVKASHPKDEVMIVNFEDDVYLSVPFTNDPRKLEGEGLAQIVSRGGTAMRDALSMALDYVKKNGRHDKKVILVITDGDDTSSFNITQEQLLEKCHRMPDVLIYSIGILAEEEKREAAHARHALEQLSKASGGAAYFPETLADVGEVALRIANDIRSQYVIGYSPANQKLDGTFRTIRVAAPGGRYSVRTRTGYYASAK